MCIIIILKLVIPTPNYPAIETPQGTSSVSNPSPASGVFVGPTPVGIVPNNTETRQFMDNHVLKLPQLKVPNFPAKFESFHSLLCVHQK